MTPVSGASTPFYQDTTQLKAQKGMEGLEAVAKQFEGLFLQEMMKAIRQTSDAMASEDSPFNSEHQKVFRDMVDAQMSQEMAGRSNLGLSDAIIRQMTPHINNGVKYDQLSSMMNNTVHQINAKNKDVG